MGWISLLSGLVKFASVVAEMLRNKRLIDAGKAEAIVEGLKDVSAFVDDAQRGANGMQFDTDWSKRVRERFRKQ